MKRILAAAWLAACLRLAHAGPTGYIPQEGDLVFQALPHGDLVDAIEGASHSRYSHVGLVMRRDGAWFVREAIGPVMDTPLAEWIARGRYGHAFDAFRLRAPLQAKVPALIQASAAWLERPYDVRYRMDDEAIYCSELVYKAMLAASGVRLGRLQKLGTLDWKPWRATIEKYEEGPVPLEREMITPRAMSEAGELEVVYRGLPAYGVGR